MKKHTAWCLVFVVSGLFWLGLAYSIYLFINRS